jgi:hypothetical protein
MRTDPGVQKPLAPAHTRGSGANPGAMSSPQESRSGDGAGSQRAAFRERAADDEPLHSLVPS